MSDQNWQHTDNPPYSYDPENPRYTDASQPEAGQTEPIPHEPSDRPLSELIDDFSSAGPEAEGAAEHPPRKSGRSGEQVSSVLREAGKLVENIGQSISASLQGRGNVVMVRVNDEALRHLDMLVEAEVVRSRSEAAALLISEGIRANENLFGRIGEISGRIQALRDELRQSVRIDRGDVPPTPPEVIDEP